MLIVWEKVQNWWIYKDTQLIKISGGDVHIFSWIICVLTFFNNIIVKVIKNGVLFPSSFQTIATVCMFLAGKVEETPRPLKDVILVSYEIIHKKDAAAMQRIKQKVTLLCSCSYSLVEFNWLGLIVCLHLLLARQFSEDAYIWKIFCKCEICILWFPYLYFVMRCLCVFNMTVIYV